MDPTFVEGLHGLLAQSTANDTNKLKAATAELNKNYYKNPACVPALAQILTSAPEPEIRQLAAVEMRKRVSQQSGDMWTQVPQAQRDQIKVQLPQLVIQEPFKPARHSAARVIAAIATIEVPNKQWPELLPFLVQTVQSPQVAQREIGIFMLFTVLENIVEGFQEAMPQFFTLFAQLLQDPESQEVRITTVRALGTLAQYIDSEDKADIVAFQSLLPSIIAVVGQCLEQGNEEGSRQTFDVLETLLILEIPLLSKSIPDLCEFLLTCGGNRNLEGDLRCMALNALSWTVQYKKSKIQAHALAPALLQGLMPIGCEDEPEEPDDDAPSRSALRIIDTLSTTLPPSQVFPPLRTLILQYFQSPDATERRGALLALGVAVEGCSEYMAPHLDQVWPLIEHGLQDGDAAVRKAACTAVSCMCEWLDEECAEKHTVLIPAIMQLVNDEPTQRSACTALDALLEILGDNIDQYLQLIMERLAGLLETGPLKVKAVVTGAIGSAAHASKDKFLPYFEPTMQRLKHFLVLTGEGEEIELRGITMDAVGTFADAVGKDVFRPYFADMMNQSFQGIQLGSARLKECSFLFFGVLARVFGEEFVPYLPSVVPALINSFDNAAEVLEAFSSGSSPQNAIPIIDTDGDAEVELADLDVDKLLDVNSAIAVEKEIAADTIGTIFSATREHFFPYVEECTLELVNLLPHYYEGIRKSSVESLLEIVRTFYNLSDEPKWQPGAVNANLSPTVKQLITHALPPLLDMYDTEDNKGVVAALCNCLASTIQEVGPGFLEGQIEPICSIAMQVLEQKALCQQDPDQDENEPAPEDQAEYDSVLIASAGDLVAALASALGPDFLSAFNTFYPLIAKYYKKSRSLSDRSSAIGALAEIISGMKAAITPHTESLMELFYVALSDEDAEVQSNAAFAVGMLVENSGMDLSAQYLHLLAALRPMFVLPPDAPSPRANARDNASGAVARMLLKNTSAMPLDQVLPVFVESLPLKNDYLENKPVFRALFHLFRTHPQDLFPHMDRLLAIFAVVLDSNGPEQIDDDIKKELVELIVALNGQDPARIQAAGLQPYLSGQ